MSENEEDELRTGLCEMLTPQALVQPFTAFHALRSPWRHFSKFVRTDKPLEETNSNRYRPAERASVDAVFAAAE